MLRNPLVVAGLLSAAVSLTSAQKTTPAAAQPAKPVVKAAPGGKWRGGVTGKSQMDDTATIVYRLQAENAIIGWLAKQRPILFLRCKEKQTDLYVDFGMAAAVESGDHRSVRVRIDQDTALEQQWSVSTDNEALFSPEPITFAMALAKAAILRIEMTPFNARPVVVTFDVRGLNTHIDRVAKACDWNPPASPLVGLTMGEVESRFGRPGTRDGDTWYYDTPAGTLQVFFRNGVVKDARPRDFNLHALKKPGVF